MTENKKLKRKLIVQSFLPLSILIVIKSVTKETLGKIYCLLDSILHKCNIIETIQETGLRDDIWQILIGIIALWFAISGFITFWQFRQARFTAFNDDGDKIVIEDKIQDSGISFFMTFILSLLVDKVSTVKLINDIPQSAETLNLLLDAELIRKNDDDFFVSWHDYYRDIFISHFSLKPYHCVRSIGWNI